MSSLLSKWMLRCFSLLLIVALSAVFCFPAKTLASSDAEEMLKHPKPGADHTPLYNRDNYRQSLKGADTLSGLPGVQLSPANYLVKAQGLPQVYFYDANLIRIRLIDSPQTFDAWGFDWSKIIELPSLGIFVVGTPLPKSPQLVKGSDAKVYAIDNYGYPATNQIRLIPSMTIFNNYGFSAVGITQLNDLLMHDYRAIAYSLPATPTAQLQKLAASDNVWLFLPSAGNWRYLISDATTFNNWGFHWSDVQTVGGLSGSDGGVNLPTTPILIKDPCENYTYMAIPEVFEITWADLYLIADAASFNNWHFNWSNVQTIDYGRDNVFDFFQGNLETTPHLVTVDGGAQVYLLNDGLTWAYPVPDAATFNSWGFSWASITNITAGTFAGYYNDSDMPLPARPYLFKEEGSPTIFMAQTEQDATSESYQIASPTVFNNWHFNWSDVRVVPGYVLYETYNTYAPMPNPVF